MTLPQSMDSQAGSGRWRLSLACLFFLAVAAYGSLVPFQWEPLDWPTAIARFREVLHQPVRIESRTDWATNIVLFLPIGFFGLGALTGGGKRSWRWLALLPLVWLACAAFSMAIEFGQLWIPPRTCSKNDLVAECIGGFLGAAMWFGFGPFFSRWLERFTSEHGPRRTLELLLELYLLALLVYLVLPLDLTVRPAELYHKYREGMVQIMPLADVVWSTKGLLGLIEDVLLFVPVGAFVAIRSLPLGRIRPLGRSLLWGAGIVGLFEFCQLFVRSRHSSTTDIIAGTCGVAAGWLIVLMHMASDRGISDINRSNTSNRCRLAIGASIYATLVAAMLCLPFEFPGGRQEVLDRAWGIFSRPPLAIFYEGAIQNAASEVLRKLFLFGPLGVMLSLLSVAHRPTLFQRRCGFLAAWLAAVLFALGIEVAQAFLPPHIPDLTDVILGGVGAGIGVIAVDWLQRQRNPDRMKLSTT